MKKIMLIAIALAGVFACNSPKPATGNPDNDTSSTMSTGTDSTLKRDSVPQP